MALLRIREIAALSSVRFTVAEIAWLCRSPKTRGVEKRSLPLADAALLEAISRCLDERMALRKPLKPNDPTRHVELDPRPMREYCVFSSH